MFRARTAENVAILVGLQWFNRLLGIVTKVILARLLLPDDFGIFALAAGLIGFVGTFGSFGLDYAIVQKGEAATEDDYNVGMTLRIVIAAGLFVASVLLAGPWASLFPKFPFPVVSQTTQVLAIVYIVTPWSFVPATRMTAELRYRAIAVPNVAGQISNALISIDMAFAGFGVWSLVYGLLLSQVIATVAFVVMRRERFRLVFRRTVARPLMAYAKHLVSASLLAFLITNIDNLAVGYFWGSTYLGLYTVAYSFGYLPVSLLSSPAGSALFPSLTKIQNDVETLRGAYLESFSYAAVLIVPASIGIAVMAPEIVHILLGPTWIPATLALLILGFYGLGRAFVDFSSSLFAAVGTPKVIAQQNLYILIGSLILLFPLTLAYNINGTAVAMTIPVLLVAVMSLAQSAKTLKGRFRDFLSRLWGPLVAGEAMGVLVFGLRTVMYDLLPSRVVIPLFNSNVSEVTIVLLVGIPVGMALYFGLLRLVDPHAYRGVVRHAQLVLRRNPGLKQ